MTANTLQLNMFLRAKDGLSGIVHSAVTKSDKDFEELRKKIQKTSETLDKVGKGALVAGGTLTAISAVNLKSAADFETGMSSVSTLIDTNVENLGAMNKEVLNIAKRTPVALNDLTTSLYDIRSAGVAAENQFTVLEKSAQLGVAGLGSTGEAVDLVTSSLNAFQLKGEKADRVYDTIFKTVKYGKTTISGIAQGFGSVAGTVAAAGIELDDYMATVAALTTTGQPAAQAHTQIKAAISGMTRETKESKKVLHSLGAKNFKDLVQKSGGMVSAFAKITKQVQGNDAAILQLFGSTEAYNAVVGITTNQHKAYLDTINAMRNGPSLVDEAYIKKLNTVNAGLQRFSNYVQKISIDFGTYLMPYFNKFLDIAGKGLDFIDRLPDGVKSFMAVSAVATGIGLTLFGTLSIGAGAAVRGFDNMLVGHRRLSRFMSNNNFRMPTFELGTFMGNINNVKAAWIGACTDIAAQFIAMKSSAIKSIGGLSAALNGMAASYAAAPDKFAWALNGMGNALKSPIKGLWGATRAALAFTGALLTNPVTWVVGAVVVGAALIYKYWKPISGFFKGAWEGIVEATKPLHPMFNKIGQAIKPIVDWFKALIKPVEDVDGKAFNLGKTIGTTIGGAIVSMFKFGKSVADAISGAVKWFMDLQKAMWNVFKWLNPLYLGFRAIKAVASRKSGSALYLGFTPLSDSVIPGSPSVSASPLPGFAAGGFTNGLSIAGEDGKEAVISFNPVHRSRNVGIWQQAGSMLGINEDSNNNETIVLRYAPVIQLMGDLKEAPAWLLKLLDEHTKKILRLLEAREKRRKAGAYA